MSLGLSGQKIVSGIVHVRPQPHSLEIPFPVQGHALKSGALQRKVEVCRTAHILVGIDAVVPIRLIQRGGALPETVAGLTLVLHEVTEPVVLASIFVDGRLHAGRDRNLVVQVDDLFGTLDDPRQNALPGIVIKVLAIVLDVALAGNLGMNCSLASMLPNSMLVNLWNG